MIGQVESGLLIFLKKERLFVKAEMIEEIATACFNRLKKQNYSKGLERYSWSVPRGRKYDSPSLGQQILPLIFTVCESLIMYSMQVSSTHFVRSK